MHDHRPGSDQAQPDAGHADDYAANAKAFKAHIEKSLVKWEREPAPYKGTSVVTLRKNFVCFYDRFGLKIFGHVEPEPGIPPTPRHIADLSTTMKQQGVKVVLYQPYYNGNASKEPASRAGGADEADQSPWRKQGC